MISTETMRWIVERAIEATIRALDRDRPQAERDELMRDAMAMIDGIGEG